MAVGFSNINATTGTFVLSGQQYGISAHAATWGTGVQLQTLAPDNLTWLNIGTAITADGVTVVTIPGGTFRFTLTGVSGLYISIDPIPA